MPISACPDTRPYHQWFRLFRRGLPLVAEVPARQADHRAWARVTVSHEDEQVPGRNQPGQTVREYHCWQVLYVELMRSEVDAALETDDIDHYHRAVESYTGDGDDSLRSLLMQWVDDLAILVAPGVGGDHPF